jgi:Phage integrase family/Arm DNA-binding domain/Phage integrase central domain
MRPLSKGPPIPSKKSKSMPKIKDMTDRWLATLTWAKANHAVERKRKATPEKPPKQLRQVSYLQRLERGLSLMLVISPGGTKRFWALTYREGKPHYWKLGRYPEQKVKQARDAAREYLRNRDRIEADAAVGSFKEVAETWFKRHVEKNQLRSQREIRRQLEKLLYPRWEKTKFLDIKRGDVAALLDGIEDQSGASMADHVLATLRSLMVWYQSRNGNYVSPIVKGMRRHSAKPRKRILNDHEIRVLWKEADGYGTFGALLKTLLLTAQRKEKVTTMRWDDISNEGSWTIREQEREKGTAGLLKLPEAALEVIDGQPRIVGNPHVFAGSLRGRRRPDSERSGPPAFNSFSKAKATLDAKLGFAEPWTIHDLRRTARSLMSRAGVSSEHAERVLGHAIPGIAGVYDRHEYAHEKAEALAKLAALVETIINPPEANVIPLRR